MPSGPMRSRFSITVNTASEPPIPNALSEAQMRGKVLFKRGMIVYPFVAVPWAYTVVANPSAVPFYYAGTLATLYFLIKAPIKTLQGAEGWKHFSGAVGLFTAMASFAGSCALADSGSRYYGFLSLGLFILSCYLVKVFLINQDVKDYLPLIRAERLRKQEVVDCEGRGPLRQFSRTLAFIRQSDHEYAVRTRRLARRAVVAGGVLMFSIVVAGAVLYVYKPLDEWMELSFAEFDGDVKDPRLPADASRIFYYATGFSDSAEWTAFTASKSNVERHIEEVLGISMGALKPWPAPQSHSGITMVNRIPPISAPVRESWRNRGYWEVTESSTGLTGEINSRGRRVQLFYDPGLSRLYYLVMTF